MSIFVTKFALASTPFCVKKWPTVTKMKLANKHFRDEIRSGLDPILREKVADCGEMRLAKGHFRDEIRFGLESLDPTLREKMADSDENQTCK